MSVSLSVRGCFPGHLASICHAQSYIGRYSIQRAPLGSKTYETTIRSIELLELNTLEHPSIRSWTCAKKQKHHLFTAPDGPTKVLVLSNENFSAYNPRDYIHAIQASNFIRSSEVPSRTTPEGIGCVPKHLKLTVRVVGAQRLDNSICKSKVFCQVQFMGATAATPAASVEEDASVKWGAKAFLSQVKSHRLSDEAQIHFCILQQKKGSEKRIATSKVTLNYLVQNNFKKEVSIERWLPLTNVVDGSFFGEVLVVFNLLETPVPTAASGVQNPVAHTVNSTVDALHENVPLPKIGLLDCDSKAEPQPREKTDEILEEKGEDTLDERFKKRTHENDEVSQDRQEPHAQPETCESRFTFHILGFEGLEVLVLPGVMHSAQVFAVLNIKFADVHRVCSWQLSNKPADRHHLAFRQVSILVPEYILLEPNKIEATIEIWICNAG